MSTNSTPSDDRQTRLDDDRGTVFEDGTSRFTASARPSRHYHPDALILDGKYRLVEELRSGNQARAFRGVRVADSATVFVKILHNPTARPDYFAKLSTLRERILAVDHPSLLRCYDFEGNGEAWIEVYEFAEGQTLTEWNQSHHPASDGEVRTALEQLSNAIHFLHASLGLAHRDIKPDNIHVSTKEGGLRLKLLDYGTVSALETGGVTLVVGTKLYSPPESYGRYIRNDALLEKWDWFSLGRIIQEMVDGVHAYDRIAGVFAEEIARRADHAAAVQEKFDSIMMEFDYDRNRIWAGMVELSEENPGRAVWIPLLKGLLTSSRQLRWGHEEIVAFLAGRVPRYFYGTKAREEGFEYRGVKWDLVSLASHLSCAERWPEARDLLYKGLLRHHIRNELKIADLDEQIDRDVALGDRDIATALVLTRLGEGSLNPSIAGFRLDREYVKHVVDSSSVLCAMLWDRGKHLRALTSPSLEGRLASLPQVASRDALGLVGSLAREISEFTRELDRLGVPYSAKDFTSDPSIPLKFILATRRDLETEIAGFRRTEFSHTTKAELQSVYGTDDLSGSPPATVQALRFAIFHHNENGFITYRSQAEALHNQARHIKYGLLWRQVRDLVEPVYAPWLGTEKVVFWAWAIAVFILGSFALQKGQVDTSTFGSSLKVFFYSGLVALGAGGLALGWRSWLWGDIEKWAKRQLPADHAVPSPQTASQIASTRAAEYLRQVSPDLEHASVNDLQEALLAKNREIQALRIANASDLAVQTEPWSMARSQLIEVFVLLVLVPVTLFIAGTQITGGPGPGELPPEQIVDRGACPYEGCTYGERWLAQRDMDVYVAPPSAVGSSPSSLQQKTIVRAGTWVKTQTGLVLSMRHVGQVDNDVTVRVDKDPAFKGVLSLKKGQTIYLYSYLGEGCWTSWAQGRYFSCCNATSKGTPKNEWWVQIRTPGGATAWTNPAMKGFVSEEALNSQLGEKILDEKVALPDKLVQVDALLKGGASLNGSGGRYGTEPAEAAVRTKDVELLKALLSRGLDIRKRQPCLAYWAAQNSLAPGGDVMLEYLLDNGMPLNCLTEPPLHAFLRMGIAADGYPTERAIAVAEVLMKHGAKVRQLDGQGKSILDVLGEAKDPSRVAPLKEALSQLPTDRIGAQEPATMPSVKNSPSIEEQASEIESLIDAGRYDGALQQAERLVRLHPSSARARSLLERVRRIRSILK